MPDHRPAQTMADNVYLGVWTNWVRGPVFGQTLTTTKESGNLLIAFTAVFVGLVASRFWIILCLCLHRFYSTQQPRNTLHHQRQVILRNSVSPEASLSSVVQALWAWRRFNAAAVASFLPVALLATITLVAFTAAGGFSSSISSAVGDEVLINNPNCGLLLLSSSSVADSSFFVEYQALRLNDAANYAQLCYDNRTDNGGACNRFVTDTLPTASTNTSASCPFAARMCRNQNSNVRLDTGYIDGNRDVGLNAPDNKSFKWRYVLHCAPIVTDGFVTHYSAENGGETVRFHYGSGRSGPLDNQTSIDYLYEAVDLEYQYPNYVRHHSLGGQNFQLE